MWAPPLSKLSYEKLLTFAGLFFQLLANHLSGAGRTVAVAGNNDVHAVEGLVALHTQRVNVGNTNDGLASVELVDRGLNILGSAFNLNDVVFLGILINFSVAIAATQAVGLCNLIDVLLVVEAYSDKHISGILTNGNTECPLQFGLAILPCLTNLSVRSLDLVGTQQVRNGQFAIVGQNLNGLTLRVGLSDMLEVACARIQAPCAVHVGNIAVDVFNGNFTAAATANDYSTAVFTCNDCTAV